MTFLYCDTEIPVNEERYLGDTDLALRKECNNTINK